MAPAKVLIVTLPLGSNYGGILQAYALQRYISDMGLHAETTSLRRFSRSKFIVRAGYHQVKRIVHRFHPTPRTLTPDVVAIRNQHTEQFIQHHIRLVDGKKVLKNSQNGDWAALVVGSDQVWRHIYTSVEENLLAFATDWDVIRLSYAASFGRDDLSEYPPELLQRSAELAQKFNAISVREKSGVDLVRKHWECDVEQHLDPTMLLDATHYRSLLAESTSKVPNNCLFAYVLDRDERNKRIIQSVSDQLGREAYDLLPPPLTTRNDLMANLSKYQMPPVTDWLQSFANAEFVVTDSFHGTVFSILFEKPFVVVGNPKRGLARIQSLLEMFGLEDRFVEDESQVTASLLTSHPDWAAVRNILESQRERSTSYLRYHLTSLQR